MNGPEFSEMSQKELVCAWVEWLSGAASGARGREVASDIARPDSRIFAALEEFDAAVTPLYPVGPVEEPRRRWWIPTIAAAAIILLALSAYLVLHRRGQKEVVVHGPNKEQSPAPRPDPMVAKKDPQPKPQVKEPGPTTLPPFDNALSQIEDEAEKLLDEKLNGISDAEFQARRTALRKRVESLKAVKDYADRVHEIDKNDLLAQLFGPPPATPNPGTVPPERMPAHQAPAIVDSIKSLLPEVEPYPPGKPLNKNDQKVVELRGRVRAVVLAHSGERDKDLDKLRLFLKNSQRPEDAIPDLKAEIAGLDSRTPPDLPILLRPYQDRLYNEAQAALRRSDIPDTVLASFVSRARRTTDLMGMIVPLYCGLDDAAKVEEWARLRKVGRFGVPIMVVITVSDNDLSDAETNLPNVVRAEAYQRGVAALQASGIRVLASINCARVARESLEDHLRNWVRFCPSLQGFLFVNQPLGEGRESLMNAVKLVAAARNLSPACQRMVFLTGGLCDVPYLKNTPGDTVFCMTGTPADMHLPGWTAKFDASRFGSLFMGVPAAAVDKYINDASKSHISWVYTTDRDTHMQLPSYWEDEVATLRGFNLKLSAGVAPAAPPADGRPR